MTPERKTELRAEMELFRDTGHVEFATATPEEVLDLLNESESTYTRSDLEAVAREAIRRIGLRKTDSDIESAFASEVVTRYLATRTGAEK